MKNILFSDLTKIVKEKDRLSPISQKDFWQTVPYETADTKGVLLSAKHDCFPQPITLCPRLQGWYRIYVGCVALINQAQNNIIHLKTDIDESYTPLRPHRDIEGGGIEEFYWKCADLTGHNLILAKFPCTTGEEHTILGWLRFEEMTPEEIDAFHQEQNDTSHRHIYATNDMHNIAYYYGGKHEEIWKTIVQSYEQSDVEWLSMEDIFANQSTLPVAHPGFSFNRRGDEQAHAFMEQSHTPGFYTPLVRLAHKLGIKTAISFRMGQWCVPYPYDGSFTNTFWEQHPEYRCIDRDGTELPILSYAYVKVQDYVIQELLRHIRDGFDAVDLLFHRGIPYVLFEEPFIKAFTDKYGNIVDPCTLPWKDKRIRAVRCEILTSFIARLRDALTHHGFAHIRIHIRCMHSIEDNLMLGIDPYTLVQHKLVDAIIPHPLFARENLQGENIWKDEAHTQINIETYTQTTMNNNGSVIWRHEGFDYRETVAENFKAIGENPISEKERLREWVTLQKKYNIDLYFEIMPRIMSAESYRKRILEIADAGGAGISLWDTYNRSSLGNTWNLLRHGTHTDWVRTQNPEQDGYCKRYRFQWIGGLFIGRYRPHWSI